LLFNPFVDLIIILMDFGDALIVLLMDFGDALIVLMDFGDALIVLMDFGFGLGDALIVSVDFGDALIVLLVTVLGDALIDLVVLRGAFTSFTALETSTVVWGAGFGSFLPLTEVTELALLTLVTLPDFVFFSFFFSTLAIFVGVVLDFTAMIII